MTTEISPAEWLTLPDVSERLDLPILKVRQLLREGQILAVRRDGVLRVPSELLATPLAIKHLPGVLNLLRDAGYNDEEALRWLYTPDEYLEGTPAAALSHRSTEVKRRAQAAGY
ncbi:Rv2175c family DNA-binding protein [Longispora sp. NPDC051575]|uniref:Rv2175c family DNA-binding protein n=1 Tax=Longispora sp. NPDC051575 TaxID=3154943 RepID=UPI003441B44E